MKNRSYEKRTVLICAILGLALILLALYLKKTETKQNVQYKYYTVKANDKIDNIAARYYPDTYPLKARSDIKKLNNMTESDIYPGQVLKLEGR